MSEHTHRVADCNRAAAAKGYVATLTVEQWEATLAFFGGTCAYCGSELERPHIRLLVPLARGGGSELANALPCCSRCQIDLGARLVTNKRIKRFARAHGDPRRHPYDPLHRRKGPPGSPMACGADVGRAAGDDKWVTCPDCERR